MKLLYFGSEHGIRRIRKVLNAERASYDVIRCESPSSFGQESDNDTVDLILFDFSESQVAPDELLKCIASVRLSIPSVAIASAEEEKYGLLAIQSGAADYLIATQLLRLPLAIQNAAEKFLLQKEHDLVEHQKRKLETKLAKAARLYGFLRKISHAILTANDESGLFRAVCRIATEIGGFPMAWVGLLEPGRHCLNLAESHGIPKSSLHLFNDVQYDERWPQHQVLNNDAYFVCNDVGTYFDMAPWRELAVQKELGSFIVLPLRRGGLIIGTFSLYSSKRNFFSKSEIDLLEETALEISFKLDVYEKDRLQMLADQKLKQNEQKLRQAQATAQLGSWDLNFATGISEWSEEAARIYGLDSQENKHTYKGWLSFIHPNDLDYVLTTIERAKSKLDNIRLKYRILRKDGAIRFVRSDACYVFDESGTPTGLHGTVLDVTEIVTVQEALRESEMRYSTLFHMSPQPGWLYDLETFRIVQVNMAAIDHYGYTEEEFLNMTIWDFRPKEDIPMVQECIRSNVSRKQAIHTKKFRHIKKNGAIIDVDVYSSEIIFNERAYRLILSIDVTDRNKYEDGLTAAIIQAQENERNEIGLELHENVCQVLASSLLKLSILQGSLPPDLSKSFKQARSTISLATKEIRNISHRLAPASFSESTLKESLSLLLKTYNAGKKYNISLDYDPRIDTYPFSHSIKLNLYRIIQEQLSGIIKHSVASHIILSLYIEGTMLKLRIADNACCCEIQEMQNSISFANMKRRVQLFSGSIELVSIPDEGHHIRIEIPVQKCLAETVASAAAVHN